MANTIKTRPSVGDIMVIIDGKKRFLGEDATMEFVNTQQCVGVVYDIQGNFVRIVAGVNNQSKQWSCVADYEITSIPSESGDYEVKLNNVVQGNFSYSKNEGTIAEFATQLEAWLRSQSSSSKSAKWEAYTNDGHSYLQMFNYNEYESTVTIAGTALVKLIGNEVSPYTLSSCRNGVKQSTTYNGMCRARLEAWAKNNTDANNNPTTRMNGTTQLFVTFPCSKIYYDGSLGDGLRDNFATYGEYLDACMVRLRELNHGIMQYRDGKLYTSLLKDKTILKQGVETYAYTSARYAYDYDCGVEGYGVGTFWMPSMYELGLLMKDITNGVSGVALDKVNTALSKKTGWSQISSTSYRWSCSRCNSYLAWLYHGSGICNHNHFFCGSLPCSAVSAFNLND